VSELHTSERIATWLEKELAHHLGPVAAPESLWNRIQEQKVSRRRSCFRSASWPVVAALLLTTSGGIAWHISKAPDRVADMEKLAEHELQGVAGGLQGLNLCSGDPAEIRTWVKAKANVDIDLPIERSVRAHTAVRLLGARLIQQHGATIASLAYRTNDNVVTLLVARARSAMLGNTATAKHLSWRMGSVRSARLFSWSMGEQVYTIASSDTKNPRGACLLCHPDARWQTTLN
jgi:hypothetical protein